VISRFIDALLNGEPPTIYGDGQQSRDFTYILNVVDANLKAAESESAVGQVINIANGQRITINQVFEMVKKLTGRTNLQAQYAPTRTGDVRDSLADLSLARALLAYEPRVQLEEGLRSTIDWWTSSRFSKAAG
jgi:UDP-glucose 4-epimerase